MALDGETLFWRLKDVQNACKRLRNSPKFGGISSVQYRKVGRSWRLQICFHRLLWVRIEIDQLYEDKSLALRARDLIFFTTDLQTVNYYTTIHC